MERVSSDESEIKTTNPNQWNSHWQEILIIIIKLI